MTMFQQLPSLIFIKVPSKFWVTASALHILMKEAYEIAPSKTKRNSNLLVIGELTVSDCILNSNFGH